ncbi:calcium/sodium antiporter [Verrucomicrobiaceae bacterium 5K15]|uniref:Calcium/sodium antiporter n=1 Tax=Oceaniferula flava TaxID=2800421 RepID=A0AAE2S969_9BACT|nr:calcium/sodium antiporter [Oceaniferula flavus]MBM1134746.1 calcium/sodium antiporter [Oceaniferula flavus]
MVCPVDLTIHLLWLTGGLVFLYFGAEWLVKGASEIALRLGISPLVVGLTVVAFGTSMPELLVCLKANSPEVVAAPAAWFGFAVDVGVASPDIAFGNIVGSNIFNIALILGVASLIRPIEVHSQLIRRELPILIVASLVFVAMMSDMVLMRWEGALLAAGVVTYVFMSVRMARGEKDIDQYEEFSEEEIEKAKQGGGRLLIDLMLIVVGIGALVVGADWLVDHGESVARVFGVPEVIISLTLFALGTSLPELATSVVAALKRQGDIITGNAIGSCIFNLLAVMGVTASVKPLQAEHIAWMDLWVMLGLAILIMPFMWSRKRINRVEGAILTAVALGYSVLVVVIDR